MKYNNGDMVKIKNITLGHGDEWNGKIGVVTIGGDTWISVKGHDNNKERETVFHNNHLIKIK